MSIVSSVKAAFSSFFAKVEAAVVNEWNAVEPTVIADLKQIWAAAKPPLVAGAEEIAALAVQAVVKSALNMTKATGAERFSAAVSDVSVTLQTAGKTAALTAISTAVQDAYDKGVELFGPQANPGSQSAQAPAQ